MARHRALLLGAIGLVATVAAAGGADAPGVERAAAQPPTSAYDHLAARPRQYSAYLVRAKRAGIIPILKASRARTFIVPTNDAFAQVQTERARRLLRPENKAELRKRLLAGVLDGARAPAQLRAARGRPLKSVARSPARISTSAGEPWLRLNGAARIARAGATVGNGRVYASNVAFLRPDRTREPGYVAPASYACTLEEDGVLCTLPTSRPARGAPTNTVLDLRAALSAAQSVLAGSALGPATPDSLVWILAWGGAGASGQRPGNTNKNTSGGAAGPGGSSWYPTTLNRFSSAHSTTQAYYWVGAQGVPAAGTGTPSGAGPVGPTGGGGGASSIVALSRPAQPDWSQTGGAKPPPMSDVIAIGGGGGGGGASSAVNSGGSGGRGGIAFAGVAPTSPNNSGSGANGETPHEPGVEPSERVNAGAGGNQPFSTGLGGKTTKACTGPWCAGINGIGGFGGAGGGQPALIPDGTWAPGAAWLNADFYTSPGPTVYVTGNMDPLTDAYTRVPGTGGGGMASDSSPGDPSRPICGSASNGPTAGGLKGCGGGGGGGWGGGAGGGNATDLDTFFTESGAGGGGGGSYAPDAAQCNPLGTGPQAEATNNGHGVVAVYFVMTKTCTPPPEPFPG